jgi:hypothetical protein
MHAIHTCSQEMCNASRITAVLCSISSQLRMASLNRQVVMKSSVFFNAPAGELAAEKEYAASAKRLPRTSSFVDLLSPGLRVQLELVTQ